MGVGLAHFARGENGEPLNKTQLIKLMYPNMEWKNFLKNCRNQGFVKLDVEKVFDITSSHGKSIEIKEADISDAIKKEVKDAFYGEAKEVKLTPEQEEIKKLQAQVAELMSSKEPKRTRRNKEQIEADNAKK